MAAGFLSGVMNHLKSLLLLKRRRGRMVGSNNSTSIPLTRHLLVLQNHGVTLIKELLLQTPAMVRSLKLLTTKALA